MSQHSFRTVTKAGQEVVVLMGYDRPLDYVFCVVMNSDEEPVYSNLVDDDAGTDQQNVNYYRHILQRLDVSVPESMFVAVEADQRNKVGNLTLKHYDPIEKFETAGETQ